MCLKADLLQVTEWLGPGPEGLTGSSAGGWPPSLSCVGNRGRPAAGRASGDGRRRVPVRPRKKRGGQVLSRISWLLVLRLSVSSFPCGWPAVPAHPGQGCEGPTSVTPPRTPLTPALRSLNPDPRFDTLRSVPSLLLTSLPPERRPHPRLCLRTGAAWARRPFLPLCPSLSDCCSGVSACLPLYLHSSARPLLLLQKDLPEKKKTFPRFPRAKKEIQKNINNSCLWDYSGLF